MGRVVAEKGTLPKGAADGLPWPAGRASPRNVLRALGRPQGCPPRTRLLRDDPLCRPAPSSLRGLGEPSGGLVELAEFTKQLSTSLVVDAPAVLLIGLTRLRDVADTLGRRARDTMLRIVAQRLRSAVREEDVVARFGNQEFAVLLRRRAGADRIGARIVDLLRQPFVIEGQKVVIGAAAGMAVGPRDGTDAASLIHSASLALHDAASTGRRTVRPFQPALGERARVRLHLEADLRRAIARRQLELHYQPQVSLTDGKVVAFEALLRWRHPQHGLVPPAEFIPLAEDIGVIVPLGEWVLRAACRAAATWPGALTVAVNVSTLQLENGPRLQRSVAQALAAAKLAPERLELEITESALARDEGDAATVLHAVRETGVRVSMDDFGTGYSSLSQLRSFPFDKLKLDRSFVQDLADNADAAAVVRAIASMGASLGMTTTAEGVETVEQAGVVRANGYTDMQGYLVSRPIPAAEVSPLIHRINGTPAGSLP